MIEFFCNSLPTETVCVCADVDLYVSKDFAKYLLEKFYKEYADAKIEKAYYSIKENKVYIQLNVDGKQKFVVI